MTRASGIKHDYYPHNVGMDCGREMLSKTPHGLAYGREVIIIVTWVR